MGAACALPGSLGVHEQPISVRYRGRPEPVGESVHLLGSYHQCAGYSEPSQPGKPGDHGRTGLRHGSHRGHGDRHRHPGGPAGKRLSVPGHHPLSGGERICRPHPGGDQCPYDL